MASLLFGAAVLSYDQIKKTRAKRREKKAHNETRFDELERDNATRITALQNNTCFCQTSDWQGGGCEVHGYVPPAPGYQEVDHEGGVGMERVATGRANGIEEGRRREDAAPAYDDASSPNDSTAQTVSATRHDSGTDGHEHSLGDRGYVYQRGEEDGFLAEPRRAPPHMQEEEVRRINEERRKRMKAGGFTNWVLRRKGEKGGADAIVR